MNKQQLEKTLAKTSQAERDILECIILGTDAFNRNNYDVNRLADLGLVHYIEEDYVPSTTFRVVGKGAHTRRGINDGHWSYCFGPISDFFSILEASNWA